VPGSAPWILPERSAALWRQAHPGVGREPDALQRYARFAWLRGGRENWEPVKRGRQVGRTVFMESLPLRRASASIHLQAMFRSGTLTPEKNARFLLEARDEGLISFITDNGGGGLSSSIGESARFSNGCRVDLDRVP